ncbi:MAG: DsbA family protein [Patescibacteria group bacterium]
MSENKQSLLDFLGPKKSFGFGFLTAIVLVIVVGFFMQAGGNFPGFGGEKVTTFGTPTGSTGTTNDGGSDTTGTAGQAAVELNDITSDDHIRGDLEAAQVVLVEFSDLDCPFCTRFHSTVQQVQAEYGDQVAWVYRHFPLDSLHPEARSKAEATECIAELGGNEVFWAAIDALFDDSRTIALAQMGDLAEEVGVSRAAFDTCMAEDRYADEVQKDYNDAVASTGRGTPHTIVVTRDGQRIPLSGALPVDQIKSVIDPLLQ